MTVYTLLFVLFCLFQTVPAPNSKACLSCHNLVRDRSYCTQYHHCPESCFVEVHNLNGEHWYKFGCGHPDECIHDTHNHDKHYGPIICKECCSSTGCQSTACVQTTTPQPTTTTTTTTTSAPATTTTTAPVTTNAPVPSSASLVVNSTVCQDHDDARFTCADMTNFGYCDPYAGAGYALAQKRCQKTCGFCK